MHLPGLPSVPPVCFALWTSQDWRPPPQSKRGALRSLGEGGLSYGSLSTGKWRWRTVLVSPYSGAPFSNFYAELDARCCRLSRGNDHQLALGQTGPLEFDDGRDRLGQGHDAADRRDELALLGRFGNARKGLWRRIGEHQVMSR